MKLSILSFCTAARDKLSELLCKILSRGHPQTKQKHTTIQFRALGALFVLRCTLNIHPQTEFGLTAALKLGETYLKGKSKDHVMI